MIEWVSFESKAIQGFPMGDPHVREFPIYLPPGYEAKGKRRYPVVFFLAGFSGKGSTYLTDDSAFGVALPRRFDDAIRAKTLEPFIGVFPDCTSKLGHSQYVNSPAFGNYLDYVCDELVEFVDRKYLTEPGPKGRVVVGHSSGGFGALVIGMLRPDAFSWIGSSAGDSFYEVSLLRNINVTLIELEKAGGIEKFVKEILEKPSARQIGGGAFEAMLTLAMAPCYAPNLNNPPILGDLFFDLKTGAIRWDVWERYLAWDPLRMVDRYAENLKQLKHVQLESGKQDEHALQFGHRQLAEKLARLNVPHELVEYPGGHGGHHWRFESRLTRLLGLVRGTLRA